MKLLTIILPGRRALLLAAAVACALLPSVAAAHTKVDRTAPADGDTVQDVREVRVHFSRGVESELTSITLFRDGAAIPVGRTQVVPETEGREYLLALPDALTPGAYEARWKTVGGDGHVLEGTFRFVVDGPPPPPVDTAAPPVAAGPVLAADSAPPAQHEMEGREVSGAESPQAVAVRWAWFAALLGMIGVVTFRYGVLPRLDREPAHRAVAARAESAAWFVALGAAALSVATLMLRLLMQAAALGADAWSGQRLNLLLTQTGWGLAWVLQAIATLAFVLGLFVARAPYGKAAGWMGAGVGAILLSAVPALSGHAASVTRLNAIAIASDTLHVLGAGVWMGTLMAVLAVGIPAALSLGAEADGAVLSMVRGFSPLALAGAATVGLTGVVNALFQITAPADLWATSYGRTLLVKLLLLMGVAALGWYNWKKVLPGMEAEPGVARLRRSARAELGLAVLVLLVTAILVALPTP
ncbi:copper resistance CopC/CopD family protein [Longimicrobium sp.]|uniref:copper resistance CopC/CopD family protein n=1 Tax=Longimicrobium sp. TaxID=2029185 RepID=UPI002E336A52|nr:CopD family protein [Longimicrobium sp.]HEX6037829.1 CopD family protein [Longimicrobium sp.]